MNNINIKDIKKGSPAIVLTRRQFRRNADGESSGNTFDWNNLVSNIGSSISSIFGGLTALKSSQYNSQQQYQQQKSTNTALWIGIAVVAVIVIGLIVFLRK
jgi:hypothetical protein